MQLPDYRACSQQEFGFLFASKDLSWTARICLAQSTASQLRILSQSIQFIWSNLFNTSTFLTWESKCKTEAFGEQESNCLSLSFWSPMVLLLFSLLNALGQNYLSPTGQGRVVNSIKDWQHNSEFCKTWLSRRMWGCHQWANQHWVQHQLCVSRPPCLLWQVEKNLQNFTLSTLLSSSCELLCTNTLL